MSAEYSAALFQELLQSAWFALCSTMGELAISYVALKFLLLNS